MLYDLIFIDDATQKAIHVDARSATREEAEEFRRVLARECVAGFEVKTVPAGLYRLGDVL